MYAFDETLGSFSTCRDKSWHVKDDDEESYDCESLESLPYTCSSGTACLDYIASLRSDDSETGWTACCERGGGVDTKILMDIASPIFCESTNVEDASEMVEGFAILCDCSTSDYFDYDNMRCITECPAGYKWEVVDDYDGTVTGMISEIGHCVICEAGEYSMGDISAPECIPCEVGMYASQQGSQSCTWCWSAKRENFSHIPQIPRVSPYHSLISLHTQELRFVLLTDAVECYVNSNTNARTQVRLVNPGTMHLIQALQCVRRVLQDGFPLLNDHIHVYLVNRERFRLRPLAIDVSIVKMGDTLQRTCR